MENSDVICACLNLTIEDMKKAIKDGASSFEEIQEATELGSVCGACIDDARKAAEELLA